MTTPSKNPLSFDLIVFARRIFRLQVSMGQTASKAPTAKSPSTDLSGSFRTNKKSKEEGSFGKAERRPSADIRNQNPRNLNPFDGGVIVDVSMGFLRFNFVGPIEHFVGIVMNVSTF